MILYISLIELLIAVLGSSQFSNRSRSVSSLDLLCLIKVLRLAYTILFLLIILQISPSSLLSSGAINSWDKIAIKCL